MSSRTTPSQRIEELLRELKTRKRVYPSWVDKNRLDPKQGINATTAAHRIQVLEDLIEDYYQLYPALRPVVQGNFFPAEEGRIYPKQHQERP